MATLNAEPPVLHVGAAGTPAALNQGPMVVTNDGDAPLTITTAVT